MDQFLKTQQPRISTVIEIAKLLDKPDAPLFHMKKYVPIRDRLGIDDWKHSFAFNAGRYEIPKHSVTEEGYQYMAITNESRTVVIREPDSSEIKNYTFNYTYNELGLPLPLWLRHLMWAKQDRPPDFGRFTDKAVRVVLLRRQYATPDEISLDNMRKVIKVFHRFLSKFHESGDFASPRLCQYLRLAPPNTRQQPELSLAQLSRLQLLVSPAYNPQHDVTTAWSTADYNKWVDLVRSTQRPHRQLEVPGRGHRGVSFDWKL